MASADSISATTRLETPGLGLLADANAGHDPSVLQWRPPQFVRRGVERCRPSSPPRIRFNRPKADKSWSVVGGGPNFPEIAGEISYDKARELLTIPLELKPNWNYKFWLNSEKFTAFRSEDGVPLEPVEVTFKTRGN